MGNAKDMPTYRRAAADDIESLVEIRCEFLSETNGSYFEKQTAAKIKQACFFYFARALADGSFVAWLAEDEGEIIATSGICFYMVPPNKSCPNGSVAYIQNMYTKKEYRRQGIAKTLFEKTMEEAKARGCSKILLNATDMGKTMYEKFGFKYTNGDMVYHL